MKTPAGNLLYTWTYGWALRIALTVVVLLLLPGLIFALVEKDNIQLTMALTFLVPLSAFAVRSWTRALRIFSEGVWYRGWLFPRSLRYDQTASMVFWTSAEVDWNIGVDSGPTDAGKRIHLVLKPAREFRKKTIRFDMWRMNTVPSAFDTLCEQAAFAVAQRMLQRISAGETIKWGRNGVLTKEGLRVRPLRFFLFRGEELLLQKGPFFRGVEEANRFRIYEIGCSRPVFSISCKSPNYHAGQIVFSSLCTATPDAERKSS